MELLTSIALAAIPAILAITLHEAAHGYAALALGDTTARDAGRLSINPLRHIDRFGTLILPGLLILFQVATIGRIAFLFGWAKPVPVAAWRFRDPRRGMMLVAAAGPLMNFFLAWVAALLMPPINFRGAFDFYAFLEGMWAGGGITGQLLVSFFVFNLGLGLFNLLPIPPLDGGRIAVGLLPARAAAAWARLERAGIIIVLLLVFLLPRMLADFGIAFDPVGTLLGTVLPWTARLILSLAGYQVGGSPHDYGI